MNPLNYSSRRAVIERTRDSEAFALFIANVLTVNYERKVCTLVSLQNGTTYQDVNYMPADHSSYEGTAVHMPETGSQCLCAHIQATAGFYEVAIVTWLAGGTNIAQQGIATRFIDHPSMPGWNDRLRGTYRKAYPGQHTVANSHGYTARHDDGWDRMAADASREVLDPDSRTWSTTTSREVNYNDGRTSFQGPIVRPGASSLGSNTLPDGTDQNVAYLAPGASSSDRYVTGKPDVIALVEHTEKIQEFALDHPVPLEAVGTKLLDFILGTTADPWGRTSVKQTGNISHDSQSYFVTQPIDHPYNTKAKAVGPTTGEGPTPCRRGYIIEKTQGTMVGSNVFDASTYGQVLKPMVFPYTAPGRFATDTNSGYIPVVDSTDHAETRLAASAYSVRFPHEANTTRWDITKEGMLSFDIGSTLPKEKIPLDSMTYEHPHGAGRSIEGHLVGSMKLVVGKNRDEEDSIDLQALGQTVLRLGADDTSLPNARRKVATQIRGKSDVVLARDLQYWANPHLNPGDAGSLDAKAKIGGENISLRAAFDGGTVIRMGARNQNSKRRHLINGYQDGPGTLPWGVNDAKRVDSKTTGRPTYGAGDSVYRFHDLTQAGKPTGGVLPFNANSGPPVANMDTSGLSLDAHLVQDAMLRIGKNASSGQSLLLDLAGGIAAAIGGDNQGRSLTATLDGGVELVVGPNKQGKGIRLEIHGDVDWNIYGHLQLNVSGDYILETNSHQHICKTGIITKAQNQTHVALGRMIHEAPSHVNNEGAYVSDPDQTS